MSPSSRIRVTLSESDYLRLSWLAGQSGTVTSREATILLVGAINFAVRRWRVLLGSESPSSDDLETLRSADARQWAAEQRLNRTRDIEHRPIGTDPADPGDPPLTLPGWEQDELPHMPGEIP